MPRFHAPPPNGDSRQAIEQRARDATRPAAPEKKGRWPFSVNPYPFAGGAEDKPQASSAQAKKST